MRLINAFRLVLVLTLVAPGLAAQSDLIPVPLEWKAVQGAGGYRVEIQSSAGKSVFAQDLTEPRVTPQLAPGSYQIRISSLNRFGKVDSATPWTPLNVKKIPTPVVKSVQPTQVPEEEASLLAVQGSGEDDKTTWSLVSSQGTVLTVTASPSGPGWSLSVPGLAQGTYTIRATGKTGKVGELPSALTVGPHDPVVTSAVVLPGPLVAKVAVLGRYLYPGTRVELTNGGKTVAATQTGSDSTRLVIDAAPAGTYAVAVSTKSAAARTLAAPLTVLPVPEVMGIVPWKDNGVWKVDLPVTALTPEVKVFVEYAGQRQELHATQSADRVSFDVPSEWKPGTYRLWVTNSQGVETAFADGLTITEAKVVGTTAQLALQSDEPGTQASIDGGEWLDVPTTAPVEAGKNHILTWNEVKDGARTFMSAPVTFDLGPHETKAIQAAYQVKKTRLTVTDIPVGDSVAMDAEEPVAAAVSAELSVDSGDHSVSVVSPAGQVWSKNVSLLDPTASVSFFDMVSGIPQRTIDFDNGLRDWEGLVPFFTANSPSTAANSGRARALWLCSDGDSVYVRLDFDVPVDQLPSPALVTFRFSGTPDSFEFQVNRDKGWSGQIVELGHQNKGKKVASFELETVDRSIQGVFPLEALRLTLFDCVQFSSWTNGTLMTLTCPVVVNLKGKAPASLDPLPGMASDISVAFYYGMPEGRADVSLVSSWGTPKVWASPTGVAVDADGNVYVADAPQNVIRKIGADGTSSIFAGSGKAGKNNGNGPAASFSGPLAVAWGPDGLYVADSGNYLIRKISSKGVVTTVAGSSKPSHADGKGQGSSFLRPVGLTVDKFGTVFVTEAEQASNRIHLRKLAPDGTVTTVADQELTQWCDAHAAEPASPNSSENFMGMTVAADGTVLIGDTAYHAVLQVGPNRDRIEKLALAKETAIEPSGLAVDLEGNLLVADRRANKVIKVSPAGTVVFVAGSGTQGLYNAEASLAAFNGPSGLAVDSDGNVFVADQGNGRVRRVTQPAQPLPPIAVFSSTLVPSGTLSFPTVLASAPDGTIYGVDGSRIYAYRSDGTVQTIAGSLTGYVNGPVARARFGHPTALTVDTAGTLYIADTDNNQIRSLFPGGMVSSVPGTWNHPSGLAFGPSGALYVADTGNHRIMRSRGPLLGTQWERFGPAASLANPTAMAFDSHGNLFVVDGNRIAEFAPDGAIASFVGSDRAGTVPAWGTKARLSLPKALVFDDKDNLYVTCAGGNRIEVITPEGVVREFAGKSAPGWSDGDAGSIQFSRPWGLARMADGSLVAADSLNQTLRRLGTQRLIGTVVSAPPLASVVRKPVHRTIPINGQLDAWAGVAPFSVSDGTIIWPEIPGTQVVGFYLAQDDKYLYWMFTMADGRHPARVPYAFNFRVMSGAHGMEIKVDGWYDANTPRRPMVGWYSNGKNDWRDVWGLGSPDDYFFGDSFIEARFPLAAITKYVPFGHDYSFDVETDRTGNQVPWSRGAFIDQGVFRLLDPLG